MTLEEKVVLLEKRVAELENKVQQEKFVPEDSENGKCFGANKCRY